MNNGSRKPIADRLWARVDKSGPPHPRLGTPCWVWLGYCGKQGHGYIGTTRTRSTGTHRLAYELAHGPIPTGLLVCHHCDNPPCCNPDHLYVGTHSDNRWDAVNRGLWKSFHGSKTECMRGHPFTPENTYRYGPRGFRQCRTCSRIRKPKYNAKRRKVPA